MKALLCSYLLAAAAVPVAVASPVLPNLFGDNMVLQQNADARLWGTASPGSTVTVAPSWSKSPFTTRAASDGTWSISVPTPAASFSPETITVSDNDGSVSFKNILIGEVWLCSGQSNMEMPLRGFWTQPVEGAAQTIAYSGRYPGIRFITVPKTIDYSPRTDVDAHWVVSSPENAAGFSALAYHFAQSLTDILNVPVGIISCAYGGASVEGWTPRDILDTYPGYDMDSESRKPDMNDWERIGVMYNGMLNPLKGYSIRGFLWNQGESNVGRHEEHPFHLKNMVTRWREDWNDSSLPFYFVEIPGWEYSGPDGIEAALFRESQHRAAAMIPNSGVVCTSDLINPDELDDIHASRKREIGERLAFLAADRTYGIKGMPVSNPVFRSLDADGRKITLHFENAYEGFTPNGDLEGFEVVDESGRVFPAHARQVYDTHDIIVTAPEEAGPVAEVRYCFKNFAIGKVKDLMGMPLVPFRAKIRPEAPEGLVGVRDGEFVIGDSIYRYVGANMWYAPILASEGTGGDRDRLERELDLLGSLGIDNLRILVGGDGNRRIASHIEPTLQTAPGVYNDTILRGLDYLLDRLEKRGMRAVLYLNNAWEWSGGYGTYLEWAGEGECPVPAETSYPEYMEFVSRFPRNEKAKAMALDHVRNIVGRVNTVNGRPYADSPAIMAWQIANEPRAFSDESKAPFADWLRNTARVIKQIDPNHLVSTGSEGSWGTENDINLWAEINRSPYIDYSTIHIWPYNWSWARPDSLREDFENACAKTREYIDAHYSLSSADGRPLVLEEFGFPRDGMAVAPGSPTSVRDDYYEHVFSIIRDSGRINGANFWGWGGLAEPLHRTWQPADPYTGDPAQEDQGLNSVFAADKSTLDMIRRVNNR